MPRKTNRPTKEEPVKEEELSEEEEVEEEEVEEEEVEETPKKKAGKTARKTETPKKPVEETPKKGAGKRAPAKKAAGKKVTPVSEDVEKPVRKSRTVTKEDVSDQFDELLKVIENEIEKIKSQQDKGGKTKGTGIQFLRGLKKRTRNLQSITNRVMKQKQKTPRKNNNSGFLKPVLISKEMAGFTGWDQETPTSRVDVTRYLCDYIKKNDLQNPKDRRQILADDKLTKLLKYDAKKNEPLTYYRMQTFLKPHFQQIPPTAA
jgi:upstream activation factor subunit UAF30